MVRTLLRSFLVVIMVSGFFLGSPGSAASSSASIPVGVGSSDKPCVILISIDGFRWDYLDKYEAPHLRQLAAEGLRGVHMRTSFPSKTFPNHYTLVTGLKAGHHGIINNDFLDPESGRFFRMNDKVGSEASFWWGGEPVWITAQKQGLRTANMFWPGSTVIHQGLRSNYVIPYNGKITHAQRVAQVLSWLDLPSDKRPDFVTLYFSEVDSQGHYHGPESAQVKTAIQDVDQHMGLLLKGLQQRGLLDTIHLVVVSDHGMTPVSKNRVVFLDEAVPQEELAPEFMGAFAGYRPEASKIDSLITRLRVLPHVRVLHKKDLPSRFAFSDNPRIPEILVLPDEGWEVKTRANFNATNWDTTNGDHGYDPDYGSMDAFLVARGPRIQPGTTIEHFENIQVYNLLCALLHITPAPNDGDETLVRLLRN